MSFFPTFLPVKSQANNYSATLSPTKTTKSNAEKSDSSKRRKLIQLTAGEQKNQSDLQTDLIIKAINNSFIQRMSGNYHQLDPHDLLSVITEFAINECEKPKRKEDLSVRQWCVVEIDQKLLMDKEIGTLGNKPSLISSICGHHITNQERHQYNILNQINLPSSIRPYCLVLNMNSKQLHFQSHEEPNNNFFINLDTVAVTIEEEPPYNPQIMQSNLQSMKKYLNQPIAIVVDDKDSSLFINMYFTLFTLPFPFKEMAAEKEKYKYLIYCRQSLYNLLKNGISESRGKQLKLHKIIDQAIKNQSRFYNGRYATEEQFVKYCQSGDILLFRDAHTMAKVQRAITSSPYDHVAIVYRSEPLGICLFQSNSGLGVGLAPWRSLIRKHWFEGIQKISWRKLQMDKKPANFTEKIDQFVKGNLHKQFGISLPKLLKFKSMTYSKENNKSYFCSELVAELYRFLGLLDQKKSSTQYWPKDFADGKGIQILNGALDPERELVFQHQLLKQCYPGYKQQ